MSSTDRTACAPLRPTARYIPEGWTLQLAACIPAHLFSLLLCFCFLSASFFVHCFMWPWNHQTYQIYLFWVVLNNCESFCGQMQITQWGHVFHSHHGIDMETTHWPIYCKWCSKNRNIFLYILYYTQNNLNYIFHLVCIIGIELSVSSLGFRDMFTHTVSSLMQMDCWLCRWVACTSFHKTNS